MPASDVHLTRAKRQARDLRCARAMLNWTLIVAMVAAGFASIPHCSVMCGPLTAFACSHASRRQGWWRYQLGRLTGYAGLGAIAAATGHALTEALSGPWAAAFVSWAMAVALAVGAARLWRIGKTTAPLVTLRPKPRPPTSRWPMRIADVPLVAGLGTGLLPCGALYAALIAAASAKSLPMGALAMVIFGAVSAVGLLAVGWVGRRLRDHATVVGLRVLAALLMVGTVLLIVRPLPSLAQISTAHDDSAAVQPSCH